MKRRKTRETMKALAVLDMDGTLLESRSVDVLCQHFGLEPQLRDIDRRAKLLQEYEVTQLVAQLFAGLRQSDVEQVFDRIRVVDGVEAFIDFLHDKHFLIAIITNSYTFLASRLAEKLGIDAVWGNTLEIVNDVITGNLLMPLGWRYQGDCREHAVCKLHAMYLLAQKYAISPTKTLAIGDSIGDFCIIKHARFGVAFRPKDFKLSEIADVVVYEDFYEVIRKLKPFLNRD